MIHIETNPSLQISLETEPLRQAAKMTLSHQAAEGDLTIVLTDDAQLRELNRDYLGIDSPTDVLSFPASETDPETDRRYLGDVLISLPRAAEQARAAAHSLDAETRLLVIHGTLHLLGHDHALDEEKARMWKAQSEVFESLGLPQIYIRES